MSRKPLKAADLLHVMDQVRPMLARFDVATARIAEWQTGGFTGGGQEGPRGSEVSRPTEAQALARIPVVEDGKTKPTPARLRFDADSAALLNDVRRWVELTHRIIRRLAPILEPASTLNRDERVTLCQACEATISYVGEDRAKRGYCPADYQTWIRLPIDSPLRKDRPAYARFIVGEVTEGRISRPGSPHTP